MKTIFLAINFSINILYPPLILNFSFGFHLLFRFSFRKCYQNHFDAITFISSFYSKTIDLLEPTLGQCHSSFKNENEKRNRNLHEFSIIYFRI